MQFQEPEGPEAIREKKPRGTAPGAPARIPIECLRLSADLTLVGVFHP